MFPNRDACQIWNQYFLLFFIAWTADLVSGFLFRVCLIIFQHCFRDRFDCISNEIIGMRQSSTTRETFHESKVTLGTDWLHLVFFLAKRIVAPRRRTYSERRWWFSSVCLDSRCAKQHRSRPDFTESPPCHSTRLAFHLRRLHTPPSQSACVSVGRTYATHRASAEAPAAGMMDRWPIGGRARQWRLLFLLRAFRCRPAPSVWVTALPPIWPRFVHHFWKTCRRHRSGADFLSSVTSKVLL